MLLPRFVQWGPDLNHTFDIDHATQYGLIESILISNFQFWIARNKANCENERDGRTWTYNSVRALQELFPYLTPDKISGALSRLVENNILVVGIYNPRPADRTKWYAFFDETLFLPTLPHLGKSKMDLGKIPNALPENPKSLVKKDVNTDGGRASRLPATWVLPKAYGEWALAEFPAWNADHVRRVATMFKNHWIAAGGQQARKLDWYATWQNWCMKEPAVPAGAKALNGAAGAWYESDVGIVAKGRELGLVQVPGERIGDYRWRIEDHLRDNVLGNAPDVPVAPPPVAAPAPLTTVSAEVRESRSAAMRDALKAKVLPPQAAA